MTPPRLATNHLLHQKIHTMTQDTPPLARQLYSGAYTSIKLAKIMALTLKHMWLVPKGNPPREVIAAYAKNWARDLLKAAEIEVIVEGTPPPWGVMHVSNHRSFMDIIVLMGYAPGTFLSKAEVADWPIIGPAAKLASTVFVKREIKDSRLAARETLRELLEEGASITIFPEGTTRSPLDELAFRTGSFEVAAETKSKIVPIAVEYPRVSDAWINGEPVGAYYRRVFDRPMTVHMRIGPVMEHEDGKKLAKMAEDWVREELKEMHEKLHE